MADNVMLIGESFVSKASVAGDEHAALTWGAAQAGVACGVADAAATAALRAGTSGDPSVAEMLAARDRPVNPYFAPAVAVPARP
jgi:5,6,7,8-tetrahydromethanopterin hydro-lyase